MSMGKSFNF